MTDDLPPDPSEGTTIEPPPTLDMVLSRYRLPDNVRAHILTDLRAREDMFAEAMQQAATGYGMYPQIVTWVMMRLGFGSPKPRDVQALIDANYRALIAEVQQQQRENPPSDDE